MVAMRFSVAAAVLLLLFGQSAVFGLLPTLDLDRDRSFRMRTVAQDSSIPPELPVIWTELMGLRQLVLSLQAAVVDQRQALRTSESRQRDGQEAAEKQSLQLDAVQVQIEADRKMFFGLQAAAVDQRQAMRTAETRLRHGEEAAEKQRLVLDSLQVQMEADRKMMSEIHADLRKREEHQQEEVWRLQSRLNTSESSVEDLQKKTSFLAGELPFLRTRLRSSESALDQLRRKSAVLASRLCLVEDLRKRSSVEDFEVQGHQNSSQGHMAASSADQDGRRWEEKSRLDTDSSHLHHNVSALHARLLHLEGKVMTTERHLQDISDSSHLHHNVSALHARLIHLEGKVTIGERHLQDIRAAVVNTLNDTQIQSEGLQVRLSVVENLVEDLQTDKSVQSSQLSSMEAQLSDGRNNTSALEGSLRSAEARVEKLKVLCSAQTTQTSDIGARLARNMDDTAALEVRLNVSDKLLEQLKTHSAVFQAELNTSKQKLNTWKATTEELISRLHVLEQRGTQTSGETKVAFAAALTDSGSVGPFDRETTVIFSKVFANVGRAYNETSGMFTAPMDGVYVFSFTAADFLKGYMGVTLYRNQQPIVSSLDLNDHGGYASASNGALILLEAGDHVRLSLPASYRLYDDTRSFSVFSGFLLFPLEADQ
ncbi:rho-associated protein kinase 2-like isoform X1 [Phyllopteryx taeniolatus]|uniref:rho-associated protein kinase 2-like isoform X1 n=1 Tax=Phyllopteryx taeniolatus TaxID=161469 RepID=UPI002AD300CD|nr:rho-associated protein kinase 2-like isoform X1 [Phyllopteryx taeniolatus]